ncbi:MAG: hypothetical protein PF961_22150 [Planctomycetota bacterium]|jgi:hypothetical protein|nr:hypothetical protein [Planctomycetota bacterium]
MTPYFTILRRSLLVTPTLGLALLISACGGSQSDATGTQDHASGDENGTEESDTNPTSGSYAEVSGIVSIEAEHAAEVRNWSRDDGYAASGTTMRDDASSRGDGHLRFSVTFTRTGRYYVWFRMRKPAGATDGSNDCFVTIDGNDLKVHDGTSAHSVIGMGTHQTSLAFQSRPKTHDAALRGYHPYCDITNPGTVDLVVTSRAQGFLVDKIVLIHVGEDGNSDTPAALNPTSGFGPAETGASTPFGSG